jgi:hypothetical protein
VSHLDWLQPQPLPKTKRQSFFGWLSDRNRLRAVFC